MNADEIFTTIYHGFFTPFSLLLRLIGSIVQPIAGPLDSVLVKIVLVIIAFFTLHHFTFDRKGKRLMLDMKIEFKKQAFPWVAANLLAMYVTASGPYAFITNYDQLMPQVGMKMTFFNFMEWSTDGKMAFVLLLIVGFLTLLFYLGIGIRHALRFLSGLILSALAGSIYMELRIGMGFVADEIGGVIAFLISLLSNVLVVLEGAVEVCFFVTLGAWLLPMSFIRQHVQQQEARKKRERVSRETSSSSYSSTEDRFDEAEFVPVYVNDDNGNQYPVEMRGDYIVIRGPHGEVSTRWEYVKGQPYFDLNGTRFFLH